MDSEQQERDEASRPLWQRIAVRAVSSRPGAAFFRRSMHLVDRPLLRIARGRFSIASLYPALLLTTIGAKTGRARTVPLLYVRTAAGVAIIGTRFGSTRHPGWYHNLRANPEATIEIAGERWTCIARDADAAEREVIWQLAVRMYSGYRRYATRARRVIPMMILRPVTERGRRVA